MALSVQVKHVAVAAVTAVIGVCAVIASVMLPVTAIGQEVEAAPFDLWVLDKPVTDENKNDILGDGSGSVKFEPETDTLTLNNADIQSDEVRAVISSSPKKNLVIQVIGDNNISIGQSPKHYAAINVAGLVFEGDGTLNISLEEGVSTTQAISASRAGIDFNGPIITVNTGVSTVEYALAAVVAMEDITLNSGALKVTSAVSAGFNAAVLSYHQVIVNGGTLEAAAGKVPPDSEIKEVGSAIGVLAEHGLKINGGNFTATGRSGAVEIPRATAEIGKGLSVMVSESEDGANAWEWKHSGSLFERLEPYKYVKVSAADAPADPAGAGEGSDSSAG